MNPSRPPGDTPNTGGGRRRVLNHSNSASNVVRSPSIAGSPTLTHKPASTGVIRAKVDLSSVHSPSTSRSPWVNGTSSPNTVSAATSSSSSVTTPRLARPGPRVTPQSTPFAKASPTISTPLQQPRPPSPVRRGTGARSPQPRPVSSAASTPSATPDLRGQSDEFPAAPPLISHLPSSVSLRAIQSPTPGSLRSSAHAGGASSPPPSNCVKGASTSTSTMSGPAARYSSASSSSAGTNRSTPLTSPTFEPQRDKQQHSKVEQLASPSSFVSPLAGGKVVRRPPVAGSGASSATSTPTLANTRPPRRRVSSDSGTHFVPLTSPGALASASLAAGSGGLLPPLALVGSSSSPTLRTTGQRPPIWSPTLLQHAHAQQQQSSQTSTAGVPITASRGTSSSALRSPSANSGASSSSYEDRYRGWSHLSERGDVPHASTCAGGRGRHDSTAGLSDASDSRRSGGGGGYEGREMVLGNIDWSVEADKLEEEMKVEREREEELERSKVEAERAKKEAQRQRKILDLEISNTSLLTINASLERIKSLQTKEIRDLKRRLRESNLGGSGFGAGTLSNSSKARRALAAFRAAEGLGIDSSTRSPLDHSSDSFSDEDGSDDDDDDDDEPEQTWDEILARDEQFSAIAHVVERLVRTGQAAVEYQVDRQSLDHVGVGGRVLNVVEMEERRRSIEEEDDLVPLDTGLEEEEEASRRSSVGSGSGTGTGSESSSGSRTASGSPTDSEDDEEDADGDESVDRIRTHGLGIRYSLD